MKGERGLGGTDGNKKKHEHWSVEGCHGFSFSFTILKTHETHTHRCTTLLTMAEDADADAIFLGEDDAGEVVADLCDADGDAGKFSLFLFVSIGVPSQTPPCACPGLGKAHPHVSACGKQPVEHPHVVRRTPRPLTLSKKLSQLRTATMTAAARVAQAAALTAATPWTVATATRLSTSRTCQSTALTGTQVRWKIERQACAPAAPLPQG